MARGEQDRRRAPSKHSSTGPPRPVLVSKLLSRVLRHDAVKEGLTISPEGYINVLDILSWQRAKRLQVTLADVMDAVENNEKQRFGLKYTRPANVAAANLPDDLGKITVNDTAPAPAPVLVSPEPSAPNPDVQSSDLIPPSDPIQPASNPAPTPTLTALALTAYKSPETADQNPSRYLIRATQGHSIPTLTASSYLTPLTLSSPSLPSTVVHGTYHATWPLILATGGLRAMSRTHIHMATGPPYSEVVSPPTSTSTPTTTTTDGRTAIQNSVLGGTVISGMRSDAQILIYIDLRKALSAGVPFWQSENGVILSEGIPPSEGAGRNVLSIEYFDKVVEIKTGLGLLWSEGRDVQALPKKLAEKGVPRGKAGDVAEVPVVPPTVDDVGTGAGVGKRKGKGKGKPKLKVEKGGALDEVG